MKDSEFKELLNLYLDHEISAADAARLEAEVQSNPARRRLYQDYCRMQKACKILAQDFAAEEAADSNVVAFDSGRNIERATPATRYVIGGMFAAAACVALILVGRNRLATPVAPSQPVVQAVSSSNAVENVTIPTPAPTQQVASTGIPVKRDSQGHALNAFSLQTTTPLVLTSAQNDPHFAWLQDVRLTPIQAPMTVDQLRLENADLRSSNRTYTGLKPLPSDVQWTAIRFQR